MPFKSPKRRLREGWFVRNWSVALALLLGPQAHSASVTAVNAANTISNNGGTPTIYFPSQGTGTCATQHMYPKTLAAINTSSNSPGFQFTISATKALATINNGAEPTNSGQINIRAELSTAGGTALPLLDGGTGFAASPTMLNYGFGSPPTVNFAIAPQTVGAVSGYCNTYDCQPAGGTAPTSVTVLIGLVAAGSNFTNANADYTTVNIVVADCPFGATAAFPFSLPTYNYSVAPGDSRAKLTNSTATPTDTTNPIIKTVVFADNVSAPNTSSPIIKEIQGSSSNTTFIEGLTNDRRYCFGIGYVNAAGFLSTDANWTSNLFQPNFEYCTTPSKVDGFLQRSTCFIASVAYGDEWDGRLEVLRQFRDQLLERTSAGHRFTEWYYTWSPGAAHWVLENPGYRGILKAMLLPVVESAKAALWLKSNLWVFFAIFLIGTAYLLVSRLRRPA